MEKNKCHFNTFARTVSIQMGKKKEFWKVFLKLTHYFHIWWVRLINDRKFFREKKVQITHMFDMGKDLFILRFHKFFCDGKNWKKVEQALSKLIGTKFQRSEKMNSAINYPWNEPLILIESLMLGSLKFFISLNSKLNLKIHLSDQHSNCQLIL